MKPARWRESVFLEEGGLGDGKWPLYDRCNLVSSYVFAMILGPWGLGGPSRARFEGYPPFRAPHLSRAYAAGMPKACYPCWIVSCNSRKRLEILTMRLSLARRRNRIARLTLLTRQDLEAARPPEWRSTVQSRSGHSTGRLWSTPGINRACHPY